MTALKDIDAAIDDALLAEVTRPEPVRAQVDRTGLHPIEHGGRGRRAAHAAPWTADRVFADARDALLCAQSTGRRVDRARLVARLNDDELRAADWTLGAVAR